jgi:short-subunit dehydrogenase
VLSKKSFTDRSKVVANCNEAKNQLKNKVEIIEIDLDDTKEASTIKQLGSQIKPNITSTIVINPAGQTTGTFDGAVEANQLVLAATKVVKSSCCPSGSSSGCK